MPESVFLLLQGSSTSQFWMSRLDNGTNYCNLKRVVQGRYHHHSSTPPLPSPSNRHTHLFQTPNLNLYYDNQTPCRYIIESRLYRFEKSNCLSFQEIKGSTLSTGVYGPKNVQLSLCKRLVKYEVIFLEPQSCHVMPMQSRSCAIMCEV